MRRPTRPRLARRDMKPLNVTIVDPEVMTLHQAADFVAKTTGVKPHCNTMQRWVVDGVRGHRLRATRVGNLYVTHRRHVVEFLSNSNTTPTGKAIDAEGVRHARAEQSKRTHGRLAAELGLGD